MSQSLIRTGFLRERLHRTFLKQGCPMMSNSKPFTVILTIIVLSLLPTLRTNGQTGIEPKKVNFCDVVASPAEYNGKTLFVEVILSPSEHALYLFGPACVRPREGYDDSTQAVLATGWENLPNGKKLRSILKHHGSAKVEVIGTFEGGDKRYGPDGAARFRFSISQINSVSQDLTKAGGEESR